MTSIGLVREIVETYELPERLEEKITRIVIRWVKEAGPKSFYYLYEYIAELVGKFRYPFKELSALSMDSLIRDDSKDTYHNIIGSYDPNLSKILEDEEEVAEDYATDLIKRQIRDLDSRQLYKLLDQYKLVLEKEKIFIAQQRPVFCVEVDLFDYSFSIKSGNRNYGGNPLDFFKKNIDRYKEMDRGKLSKYDPGLYRALLRYDQLKDAIPKIKKGGMPRVSPEDINKITATYNTSSGNSSEAERILRRKYSRVTIAKYWRIAGLPYLGKRGRVKQNKFE